MTASRVGELFGPYELRSRIGAGGMGEVYQAYDTTKDRVVALKLLRPEFAADRNFQERFRRESRMAARLHEPHVIPVHDFGEINGVLFIDMRFVDGADLKSVLERGGPLSRERTTAIIEQIASALDAAHASGLTHRDVKPENILITGGDFAYLVDFGIARAGGDSGLTSAGSAIGSCAYMAPERFTGDRVGPPADVYSLACVAYECLTGHPPFPAGDLTRLMSAHILSPPPRPSATRPELAAFDGVIAWGMAKDSSARPSAAEFARATSASAISAPAPPPAHQLTAATAPTNLVHRDVVGPGRRSPKRLMTIAASVVVAVLVTAAVATWLVVGDDDTGEGAHSTATATLTRPSTTAPSTRDTATTNPPTTTATPVLPGTDAQGFLAHPGARCDPGDGPAALGLTAQSALVVCQMATGGYYYRGVRLSDDARIQLDDATRASDGFDVVNPADGTRYRIRSNALTIVTPDNEIYTEPMTQYAS